MNETPVPCIVYRCTRQPEMYLYAREDLDIAELDPALLAKTGRLEECLRLALTPARRLARVEARSVIAALRQTGWFLQLPPPGQVEARLYRGD